MSMCNCNQGRLPCSCKPEIKISTGHPDAGDLDAKDQRVDELEGLLRLARQFVVNGIDLGYIQMPDADTPDPAHYLVPKIDAALNPPADYPGCSGTPSDCPENEGYGCCGSCPSGCIGAKP